MAIIIDTSGSSGSDTREGRNTGTAPSTPSGGSLTPWEIAGGASRTNQQFIPDYISSGGTNSSASRSTLSATQTRMSDIQITCAGDGDVVPILLGGQERVGIKICAWTTQGTNYVFAGVLCEGEIEEITDIQYNNEALPSGMTVTSYRGTPDQVRDPTLVAAFAAQGIAYEDDLPGIAYLVVKMPTSMLTGQPNITAKCKGLKFFDPRDPEQSLDDPTTWKYTNCPALCTAGLFYRNTNLNPYNDSLTIAANANDDLVNGEEPRRQVSLLIDRAMSLSSYIETLRSYAAMWCVPEGRDVVFVPDRPAESVAEYDNESIIAGSFSWSLRGPENVPTAILVRHTNVSVEPWSERMATAVHPDVEAGIEPRRESILYLQGIKRYSQALREAIETLNHYNLELLTIQFGIADEGAHIRVGDVITVSYAEFFVKKLFRVTGVTNSSAGRYTIAAKEYDDKIYSDAIEPDPSEPDTPLPNPLDPPSVVEMTISERVYKETSMAYASQMCVTWSLPDTWPYDAQYIVMFYEDGLLIDQRETSSMEYRSPSVDEGKEYTATVYVTSSGITGAGNSISAVAQGRYLPPGDVPRIIWSYEVGGDVYLGWEPAVDITVDGASDIVGYEIRRVSSNVANWNAGEVVAFVTPANAIINLQPPGMTTYMVKAKDSVGLYSENAASTTLTITLDDNSRFVDNWYVGGSAESVNVTGWRRYPNLVPRWTSDRGESVDFGHADPDPLTGTFIDLQDVIFPLPNDTGSTSVFISETHDSGTVISGQWTVSGNIVANNGGVTTSLELSSDGTRWTRFDHPANQSGSGRYSRVRVESRDGSFTINGKPNISVIAIPKQESGTVKVGSTGVYRVTCNGRYAKFIEITLNYAGARLYRPQYDNVHTSNGVATFDVYLFDPTGQRVSGDVNWIFKGV